MQVWSRFEGYPGDGVYLEFHKIKFPGGLKLWQVSGPGVDLGAKEPYDSALARDRARGHADHFAGLLGGIAAGEAARRDGVIVAPFDTELFGHWWFEGPDFLGDVYRALRGQPEVRPATGSSIWPAPPRTAIRMPAGSWGANGDFSMWLSDQTAWTWERLWPLEERFWDVAPAALASDDTRSILAQAARELLLLQSSDWQFIISTGAAADYEAAVPEALQRYRRAGCDVRTVAGGARPGHRRAAELCDALFPDGLRRSPRHSRAPARSRSADPWHRSASRSDSISINPSATSTTSSRSTWTTSTAHCSTPSPTAGSFPSCCT
jgi:1,4-alpha-glucan branching enzyme